VTRARLLGAAIAVATAGSTATPASPPPACRAPSPSQGPLPWRTGETHVLALDVFGVVKAGTLELSVERPMSRGKVVPLRARARATSAVGAVKKLTAVGLSWVDARTLVPERYRDESDEDGLHRMTDTRFPRGGGPLPQTWRTGDRSGARTLPATGQALDALSALYALRASRLAPGDRLCFEAVGKGRLWRAEGVVSADRERVEAPAGRFDTLRVDLTAVRVDRPDVEPVTVHLWLSADDRRLLVAAVGELDIGPVRAQLTEVRGAAARPGR
jgi:hypothetical protein